MYEFLNKKVLIAAGIVGVASAVGLAAITWYNGRRRSNYTEVVFRAVGNLSRISIYPVKSFRGQELRIAEVKFSGLCSNGIYDRHFVVVNGNNTFVTMRQKPSLALVRTTISDDGQRLTLDAPGMNSIIINLTDINTTDKGVIKFKLWGIPSEGVHCGQEAATWISTYLKKPDYKLIFFKKEVINPRRPPKDTARGRRFNKNDTVSGYPDLSQFMLLTDASLTDLNTRLTSPITMKHFRPNFVVSGTQPFDEDKWKYIRIGKSVTFRYTQPCGRCRLTLVDPETGIVDSNEEPLKTLRQYRVLDKSHPDSDVVGQSPTFGIHLQCDISGPVHIGDTVYAAM